MKLIDIDAVVAEIERLLNSEIGFKTQGANFGYKVCLKDIMRFIDILEAKEVQEEPVSNDLEAEFVLYLKHKFNIPQEGHKLKTNGWRPSPYDILDIAKHFAQWQKEQLIEKMCVFLESTDFCKYYNKEFVKKFKKAMEK